MKVIMTASVDGRQMVRCVFNRVDSQGKVVPIEVVYEVVWHGEVFKRTNIPGFFGPKGCVRTDTMEAVVLTSEESQEVQTAILAATQDDVELNDWPG